MNLEEMWNKMLELGICQSETLHVACYLNGHTKETLESVLFIQTGYRTLEQMEDAF